MTPIDDVLLVGFLFDGTLLRMVEDPVGEA
jgi:hypothetical protein